MKKKKKEKKIVLVFTILLILAFSFAFKVKADSGFDSSWDSGGSFDGGSWSSSSGGGGLGKEESIFVSIMLVFLLFELFIFMRLKKSLASRKVLICLKVFYPLTYVLILYIYLKRKFSLYPLDFGYTFFISFFFYLSFVINGIKQVNRFYSKQNVNLKVLSKEEIKNELGADFDLESFYQKVYQVYYAVQIAWMNHDLDQVRNVLSDEMFNMYKMQLLTLEQKQQKNMMEEIKLEDIGILAIRKNQETEEIDVNLKVTCRDYLIDTKTAKVIRGKQEAINLYSYCLTFVRNLETNDSLYCPNCGSKLENAKSIKCAYCNSVIVRESTNFVMTNKKMLSQTIKEYRKYEKSK